MTATPGAAGRTLRLVKLSISAERRQAAFMLAANFWLLR